MFGVVDIDVVIFQVFVLFSVVVGGVCGGVGGVGGVVGGGVVPFYSSIA